MCHSVFEETKECLRTKEVEKELSFEKCSGAAETDVVCQTLIPC